MLPIELRPRNLQVERCNVSLSYMESLKDLVYSRSVRELPL